MRFLKHSLLLAALSLAFISCENKIVNNYPAELGVNIKRCDYQLLTIHRSYYEPDYPADMYYYYYGMRLTVRLDDPSKNNNINRLIVKTNAGFFYDFNKQELQDSYRDSIGGYELDVVSLDNLYSDSLNWSLILYDASNNPSNEYILLTRPRWNMIQQHLSENEWYGPNILQINMTYMDEELSDAARAETHFLDLKREEVKVYNSSIENFEWKLQDVPAEAVYFYYVLTDNSSGINKKFISTINVVAGRLPENVEYISEIEYPEQIEYIQSIDKILTLSPKKKEIALINYEDNSIVWKKQLNDTPLNFSYSKNYNTIFLASAGGAIDSINPADGSGGNLYIDYLNNLKRIIAIGDYIYLLSNYGYGGNYDRYNIKKKEVYLLKESLYYDNLQGVVYSNKNNMLILRENSYVTGYIVNMETGDLTLGPRISFGRAYEFKTLVIDPLDAFIGVSEGVLYEYSNGSSFTILSGVQPFYDITSISSLYIVSIAPAHTDLYGKEYPSSLSLYNSSYSLLGTKTGLPGAPMKICSKGNILKVYSVQKEGGLIAQKFTVQELLTEFGKANKAMGKKMFMLKKL